MLRMANPMKSLNEIFDHTTCSRCGGDKSAFSTLGHINGGRCLKCDSSGFALTALGMRQLDFFNSLTEIAATDVEVGMKVRMIRSEDGGRVVSPSFRVSSIERDGDKMAFNAENGAGMSGFSARTTWKRAVKRDQYDANIARAIKEA